jgi:hypothetical protein
MLLLSFKQARLGEPNARVTMQFTNMCFDSAADQNTIQDFCNDLQDLQIVAKGLDLMQAMLKLKMNEAAKTEVKISEFQYISGDICHKTETRKCQWPSVIVPSELH